MVAQHYRWDFIGLSTDTKPTPETSEKVTDGSTYYTSDDSKLYVWYSDQWYEKEDTGGGGGGYVLPIASDETLGGVKVGSGLSIDSETGVLSSTGGEGIKTLTEDDYDYHRTGSVDDGVALWRLDPGIYKVKAGVKVYYNTGPSGAGLPSIDTIITIYALLADKVIILVAGTEGLLRCYSVFVNNGSETSYTVGANSVLSGKVVVDNLTSSDWYAPLSANQGKVLKALIDANPGGVKIYTTEGIFGPLQVQNISLYIDEACTEKISGGDFYDILKSGSNVTINQKDTNYNEYLSRNIVGYHLPGAKTSQAFDSCLPEGWLDFSGGNRIGFDSANPYDTDAFYIEIA